MSNDLISREALKEALSSKDLITWTYEYGDAIPVDWLMSTIDNAPTVEQKYYERIIAQINPVIEARPQGEWKLHGMIYYCSECGHDCEQGGNNFCGNCGADMRG